MRYLSIKNWEELQHYKDRNPPWIKLHRSVLDDYEMSCLQDASKLHLILIWVLASQLNNRIPDDAAWISKKINATSKVNLKELIDKGFLIAEQDASKPIASCSPETEAYREETERVFKEKYSKEKFEELWKEYPRRDGSKSKAEENYKKEIENGVSHETIIAGVRAYRAFVGTEGTDRKYIKHATTWLHQRCWESDYSGGNTGSKSSDTKPANDRKTFTTEARQIATDFLTHSRGQSEAGSCIGTDLRIAETIR